MKKILPLLLLALALSAAAAPGGPPPIISVGANGHLVYGLDARSNRIPDFSTCGYAAGEQEIPRAVVRVTVAPTGGDETELIQRALDHVAGLPADDHGLRGTVLLLAGRHEVFGGLLLTNPGVVLRGQGMAAGGTTLVAAGLDRRTLIRIVGRQDVTVQTNSAWQIADQSVPVGATSFHLTDAGGLTAGSTIRVLRPSTAAWIKLLGANEFGGGEGGGWKPGEHDLTWDRTVKSVAGNLITIDAPITTALEAGLGGGYVATCVWPGRITNVGVENLCLESTYDATNLKDENHSWCAITLENAADAWVRQVVFQHFAGSAVAIYETCQRVTVQDCLSLAPVSEAGGYRQLTYFTMAQQTLFLRCYAEGGRHDFAVGLGAGGPNAFVQCEARKTLNDSGPVESWASGVLYDSVTIDGNALTLGYRAGNNAAIGWAAANCVLWNCSAAVIRCWNPPGAQNWAFGSWASFEGDGIWRSSNDFISPPSLFAAQVQDRLGPEAAARLKLMPHPHEESSNPPVEKAQELAAASHQPAPQLKDYILRAAERDPIPTDPGQAGRAEDLPAAPSAALADHPLVITNGWLTLDGKLLVGGRASVAFWRGNIHPAEAPAFGLGITRFVPGRVGPGFTDDLPELANSLVSNGMAVLDHHYGLWYERRRDDHERVRRINGDVLPPFYELPFARSGQGTAWEGLSQYDLTKYNPWYWSRLRQFAGLAEERGLVLFHENYFQHNVIEAGAHWADFPWRSANNINNTGFPEPPPYAGDKRIFQAELFYDVTHPVRRELHRAYIRQCLNNFTNCANVVQFTSAEFTGPQHFVAFWLDVIAEWEREQHRHVLVALCCTKDVQDAILADPARSAVVDMIVFRYWWVTDKGAFTPGGGLNLAPRQFQRLNKTGFPTDLNLATMAAEYRGKFPSKPVVAASEQGLDLSRAGWAYLCAGGSLANLPRTTDAALLAAIPRMQPWRVDSAKELWTLREPGRNVLVYGGGKGGVTVDLSGESGTYKMNWVANDGTVTTTGETVAAGQAVRLTPPAGTKVIWLTKN